MRFYNALKLGLSLGCGFRRQGLGAPWGSVERRSSRYYRVLSFLLSGSLGFRSSLGCFQVGFRDSKILRFRGLGFRVYRAKGF